MAGQAIPLEAQVRGAKTDTGLVKPERQCLLVKLSLAGTGVETPKQTRLSCSELPSTTVGDCRHADGKGSEQGDSSSLRAILSAKRPRIHQNSPSLAKLSFFQIKCLHGEVEIEGEQHKQYGLDRLIWRGNRFFSRASHITASQWRL